MTPAENTAAAIAEEEARRRRIEQAMAVYGSDNDAGSLGSDRDEGDA